MNIGDSDRQHRIPSSDPGNKPCNHSKCKCCNNILTNTKFESTHYGTNYKIKNNFDCKSKWIVYCIECKICHQQYIGSSVQELHDRMSGHRTTIKNNKGGCKTVEHFNGICYDQSHQ